MSRNTKQRIYVGLLDCNNFFVSCERLFRPDLWRKPVAVLSSNDGCIIARSQEVKDMGIPMGVPYFQVKDILSDSQTTLFSSHFALYRDISRRIFNLLRAEVAIFQQYSIDEAFFIYRGDAPQQYAESLKRQIERSVGVPVSIGLAATKTQSKYANHTTKRSRGAWYMDQPTFTARGSDIALGELWGVGAGRVRAFAAHDIHTVADLQRADRSRVARLFGVEGERLQYELQGVISLPVTSERAPQQSTMSSQTFRHSTTSYAVVADAVAYHVRHVAADLRAQGQVTGRLQVSIRPSRHGAYMLRGGRAEAVLSEPTADTMALLTVAYELLEQLWQAGVPYQKAGVMVQDLTSAAYQSRSLFPDEGGVKRSAVTGAIDAINQRHGVDMVRVGSTLKTPTWRAKRDQLSPAYTTQWSAIPIVQANAVATGQTVI